MAAAAIAKARAAEMKQKTILDHHRLYQLLRMTRLRNAMVMRRMLLLKMHQLMCCNLAILADRLMRASSLAA
jgi:hypothetical protein